MGGYRKTSRKYIPLYVTEFELRYNNLDKADIPEEAIIAC